MKKLHLIIFLLLLFISFEVQAQKSPIDSLLKVVSVAKSDTNKVYTLISLGREYFNEDPLMGIKYATDAKVLSQKLNFKKGLALSLKTIGIGYYRKGDYLQALTNWDEALPVYKSINDMAGVSNMLNNQGSVYFNQGDMVKGLELHLQSLKIAEDLNDTTRIITALSNIGSDYLYKKSTFAQAKKVLMRALPLAIKINDSYMIGTIAVNLGEIYFEEKDYKTALSYFNQSVKVYDEEDLPYSINYIGKVYTEKKEYEKAIQYHQQALDISTRIDSKLDMAFSLIGLANNYQYLKKLTLARNYFFNAKKLAIELHANEELKKVYEGLVKNYQLSNDFKNAFNYQQLLLSIKDSIYNFDNDKKMQGLQFAFDINKKESQISLLTTDQKIKEQIIKRQKLIRNGFIGGFVIMVLFASLFLRQRIKIAKEKKRSEELLLNILPSEVADELMEKGSAEAKLINEVSVLFTDFKGFTQLSEKMSPTELVSEINECFSAFDHIMEKHGIEKIKTIGDAYMAAGGLPTANATHSFDVVRAALEIQKFMNELKTRKIAEGKLFFEIRIGIHTGPVVAGIVGVKKFAYDIWGDTVNIASRMESSGEIGKVNISESTYEYVKDKFTCTPRGKIEAKGKGEVLMYFVTQK